MAVSLPYDSTRNVCADGGPFVLPRTWRYVIVCSVVLTAATFAAEKERTCPSAKGLCTLISVSRSDMPAPNLWSMGADILGAYDHRWYVRVSDAMREDLAARSVAYEVIDEDLYGSYEAYRQTRTIRRDESFGRYHDLDETVEAMERIVAKFPDIAAMTSIGTSIEGRPIYALRISDNASTIEPDEPGMVVIGCHHAREWISVEVSLYLADVLTEQYLERGDITRLVRNAEIWIIPVLNPDGLVFSQEDRWWRKNRRDNTDGTFGVDPNRNYSIGYGDDEGSTGYTLFETYRGPHAFSEPETQAMRNLMSGAYGRTFDASLSYHNFGQLIMYPNGYTTDTVPNAAFYAELTRSMAELINASHQDPQDDYLAGQGSHLLYFSSGDFSDWAHHEAGTVSLTIELRPAGPPYFELSPDEILPTCRENLPAFLHMAERTLIPELRFRDMDLDGVLDSVDYCPHSPRSAAIDELGCAASEVDVDHDGVVNPDDTCPNSLPRQQVDGDGCRLETLFSVHIRANTPSADITVVPADIDGQADGNTGAFGLVREYAEETMLMISAADTANGSAFLRWIANGEPQPVGEYTVLMTTDADQTTEAIYAIPDRAQVAGLSRIPDRRSDGLAHIETYTVVISRIDGTQQTIERQNVRWSLSDESVATITREGELIAFDVSSQDRELRTLLSAEISSGEQNLSVEPLEVTVFDLASVKPRCSSISLEGIDRVASDSASRFHLGLLLEGDIVMRTDPDLVEWSLSLPEDSTADTIPASISADGRLATSRATTDTAIVVLAAYVNDDESACLALKHVTVNAGTARDTSGVNQSTTERTLPAICGGTGMIGLLGMLFGLAMFRFTRRCP